MYPYMLLVIPVYLVMFKLGLLGSYPGIILFWRWGRSSSSSSSSSSAPYRREVIEAAIIDGAGEADVLFPASSCPWRAHHRHRGADHVPAQLVAIVPILVVSKSPDTYTLPVALLSMNSELGSNFQGIMALAVITTLPVAALSCWRRSA